MTTEMRKTGVDVVGDMPWGTHFCLFYETIADLLETLVSYCKAGLESQEFCLWVVAEPLAVEDARRALQRAVPDFDRYFADRSIEIVAARDWYLQDGTFDLNRVIGGWNEKLARASARGYAGVRRSTERLLSISQPFQREPRMTVQKFIRWNFGSLSANTSAFTLPNVVSGLCLMPS